MTIDSRIGEVTERIQRRSRDSRLQGPGAKGVLEAAIRSMAGAAEGITGVIVEGRP
ncbi:MAG TPA: hypothetical protein VN240_04120 [Propylenella sp.]|nr:hypothetical protein [Propylenella sp.]